MDLAEALIIRVKAAGAVTDLIGAGNAARVTWGKRSQGGALPALMFRQIGATAAAETLDDEGGMFRSLVEANCFARTHAQAAALARAVGDALIGEADVTAASGTMLFWDGERQGPIDLGEDTPQGFEHRAVVTLTLLHTAAD